MKKYPEIDYDQRPESYWEEHDVLAALLRNVKGRERRAMIRRCFEQGRLDQLDNDFLREQLSEGDRELLGRIHPSFMGGEYLPDYKAAEVEIARIELDSTTSDVISIRARRYGRGLAYRVVDEYETEFRMRQRSSKAPLTLGELIILIDTTSHPDAGTGLALCYNEMHAEEGYRCDYRNFTEVSSDFYPQLNEHYEHVYDDWADEP